MNHVTLVFSHDKDDWISRIMSWFSFGEFTHVAIVNGDEIIEASGVKPNAGVRLISIDKFLITHKGVEFRKINHSNPDEVWEKCKNQLGKKYDWFWVFGYLFHSDKMQHNSRWACSELITWALGNEIFPSKYRWFITPQTIFIKSEEL